MKCKGIDIREFGARKNRFDKISRTFPKSSVLEENSRSKERSKVHDKCFHIVMKAMCYDLLNINSFHGVDYFLVEELLFVGLAVTLKTFHCESMHTTSLNGCLTLLHKIGTKEGISMSIFWGPLASVLDDCRMECSVCFPFLEKKDSGEQGSQPKSYVS